MGVLPGDPWTNITPQNVADDTPSGEGNGDTEIERGESDKTPVTTVGEIGIGSDEVPELFSSLQESANSESCGREFRLSAVSRRKRGKQLTSIGSGNQGDDKRPRMNQNIG